MKRLLCILFGHQWTRTPLISADPEPPWSIKRYCWRCSKCGESYFEKTEVTLHPPHDLR